MSIHETFTSTNDQVQRTLYFQICYINRFRGPIYVAYKLEADKFVSARPSRVTFKAAQNREDGSYVDLEIMLQRQGQSECHRHMVFINVRLNIFYTE